MRLSTETVASTFRFLAKKWTDKTTFRPNVTGTTIKTSTSSNLKGQGHNKKTTLSSIRPGLDRYFMLKREFTIKATQYFKSTQIFETAAVGLKRHGLSKWSIEMKY